MTATEQPFINVDLLLAKSYAVALTRQNGPDDVDHNAC